MEKHYNLKHEVLIKASRVDVLEQGKNYSDGDDIVQKEQVDYAEYIFNTDNGIAKAILRRDMIVDLYNQIIEIESKKYAGKYSELPF